jgi:hypothetical protein
MVQYGEKTPVRMAEVVAVSAEGIRVRGQQELVGFDKAVAAYSKTSLERGERDVAFDVENQEGRQNLRERLAANNCRNRRR